MIEPVLGRPHKLTSRDRRSLTRSVSNSETKTALEAMRTTILEREDNVSTTTLRRTL